MVMYPVLRENVFLTGKTTSGQPTVGLLRSDLISQAQLFCQARHMTDKFIAVGSGGFKIPIGSVV